MEMARTIAGWSSCYREGRKIGAVIVKNKRILTTGYNGAPSGVASCVERCECMRDRLGIHSGTQHELCYGIHAEQNAIIQAAKLGVSIEAATLYCTHQPCVICAKMIVNAGIAQVIYGAVSYTHLDVYKRQDDIRQSIFDCCPPSVSPQI